MTKANVVSLHGAEVYGKGVPNPDVIEMMKDVLKLAKRGEIHGVHMVLVHDDGMPRKACVGRANYATIGCLATLTKRLIDQGLDDT